MTYVTLIVLFAGILFGYGKADNVTYSEDAVIVLGAGIQGEELTDNLRHRLDMAIDYYTENQKAIIVVSGGQRPQEAITEALAMEQYLLSQGVPEAQIIKEEAATSARENFLYSKQILEDHFEKPYCVAFITNDYHIWFTEFVAYHAPKERYGVIKSICESVKVTTKCLKVTTETSSDMISYGQLKEADHPPRGKIMEFKDKLKKLRNEKGVSQQVLADAIFVSRSAVAKWENGLGLPRGETFDALLDYFGVSKEDFVTEEPEEVIVEKNRSIYRFVTVIKCFGMAALTIFSILLPILIMSGKYGLFPEMAAGSFADNPYIRTKDYYIYYSSIDLIYEDKSIENIASFRPVKNVFGGWYVFEEDYRYRELHSGGEVIGTIYSLKGRNGYYHIIRLNYSQVPTGLYEFDAVTVDGVEHPVRLNSFFETKEPLTFFYIEGTSVLVGHTLMWWEPVR